MAQLRSKSANGRKLPPMTQSASLPLKCDDDDADDELFFPVARSSSNLGIFQLPPPTLNRQGSHESSSSENDPAQSPSSLSLTSSHSLRLPFSHYSSAGASPASSPATITTSTAATNSYEASFSSLPSSKSRAFFVTPSFPQWSSSQSDSKFHQSVELDDDVFEDKKRTIEADDPCRSPSPYGEILEPSSPVLIDGDHFFEDMDIDTMSPVQCHNGVAGYGTSSQNRLSVMPSSLPSDNTNIALPNFGTSVCLAGGGTTTATITTNTTTFDHANTNGMSRNRLDNTDPAIDHSNNETTKFGLSLNNNQLDWSNNKDKFTTVPLNNELAICHIDSRDKFTNLSLLRKGHDIHHNPKNKDKFSNLSLDLDHNSHSRAKLTSLSFDSDHETNSAISNLDNIHIQSATSETGGLKTPINRRTSIVDGLLQDIRDRLHLHGRSDSVDSDTLTECSSTSDAPFSHHSYGLPGGGYRASHLNRSALQNQNPAQLKRKLMDLQRSSAQMNASLVKHLKRRDRHLARLQRNCDIVTAVLQASSLKRQIDTRMKFSIQPPPGESAFDQWRDAMKAVCRLPMGIPSEFRKKAWLSLADHYLFQLKINWEKTVRFVFNERSNPDDEQLGIQIVKDLHRTGCSNFSGEENEEDRAILKRLLLAYARWNKRVGYCQGFNVIAALLLNVMDRREDDALKVMIYLIDSVLPESYFANNLRALSVDMAVFRDLLRLTYPRLSRHLDKLQLAAQDVRTGACYEPPLPNVFTMQWFLTLFATCLPIPTVLRVWDSILLEGSEILLRTALTIWGKLSKRIMTASSADEFYCLMGELTSSIMQGSILEGDAMIKSIYGLGEFPFPQLHELREKYTYNIRPFTPASATSGNSSNQSKSRSSLRSLLHLKYSDEDDLDDDDITAMACMPDNVSGSSDISVLGPGVYGEGRGGGAANGQGGGKVSEPHTMERMTTDIQSLKMQYERLKQRQQQAHIIIAAASAKKAHPASQQQQRVEPRVVPPPLLVANIESPTAMNHLFVGKSGKARGGGSSAEGSSSLRNRLVTYGPCISGPGQWQPGSSSSRLSTQLQAVARAQAVSKSKRMRTGISQTMSQAPRGDDDDDDEYDVTDDGGGEGNEDASTSSCGRVTDNDSATQMSHLPSPIDAHRDGCKNVRNAESPDTGKSDTKNATKSSSISSLDKHDIQDPNEGSLSFDVSAEISDVESVAQSPQTNTLVTKDRIPTHEKETDNYSLNNESLHQTPKVDLDSTSSKEDFKEESVGESLTKISQENFHTTNPANDETTRIIPEHGIPLYENVAVENHTSLSANTECNISDASSTPTCILNDTEAQKQESISSPKQPRKTSTTSADVLSVGGPECPVMEITETDPVLGLTGGPETDGSLIKYSPMYDQEKNTKLKCPSSDGTEHKSMGSRAFSPVCNEDSGVDSSPASSPMVPENSSFNQMANNAYLRMSFLDEEMILRVESETVEACNISSQEPDQRPKNEKHLQNIRVIMTMDASGETAFEAQSTYNDHRTESPHPQVDKGNENDLLSKTENSNNRCNSPSKSQPFDTRATVIDHSDSTNVLQAKTLKQEKANIDDMPNKVKTIGKVVAETSTNSHIDQEINRFGQSIGKKETDLAQEMPVTDDQVNTKDQDASGCDHSNPERNDSIQQSPNNEAYANSSPSRPARSVSMCSTESISVLLEAVTTSSPVKEVGYVRSTSVIETIPVAETVDLDVTQFMPSQGKNLESTSEEEISSHTKVEEILTERKEKTSEKSLRKISKGEKYVGCEEKQKAHSFSFSNKSNLLPNRKTNVNSPQSKGVSLSSVAGTQNNPARRLSQPFNPFPVKHFNSNRMKAGLKLGLYTPSTLEQLRGLKPRTASS